MELILYACLVDGEFHGAFFDVVVRCTLRRLIMVDFTLLRRQTIKSPYQSPLNMGRGSYSDWERLRMHFFTITLLKVMLKIHCDGDFGAILSRN